ncbi:hypothetical protein P3S68_011318 [Capsicum galapagoense]
MGVDVDRNIFWEGQTPISDVSSDLTIEVVSAIFALHKFPLILQSGRIRKLLLEAKDTKVSRINLTGLPGGSDAFELAAKFYYGVNVEITISNVALLRCATRFMEMIKDISEKNLKIRTEVFLKDAVFPNISNSISVLHRCETLLSISEEVKHVSQLINAIANNACKEQLTSDLSKLEYNFSPKPRVLLAVKIKGFKQDIINKILINYAQNSLQGLFIMDPQLVKRSFLDLNLQKRKDHRRNNSRLTTNIIQEKRSANGISAIATSASTSCKSDLERRISL